MGDGGEEGELTRKVRGLRFLDNLRPGERFQVESWLNAPVGPNSSYMSTYISHLAKDGNNLPLTIQHWTQMPAESVLKAMLEVKKVFDYPDDLNDWIRAKLQDRWRNHKHFVKKEGFYKYTTQEERLANRPKDVVESQWGPLVEYWQNPKQEALSAKMRAIKSKQTVHQSTGSKSHVKYAAELEAKLKRPPTAQEIYDATHAKRKKKMVAFEQKPSQQTSENSSNGQNDAIVQHAGQDFMSPVSSSKEMKMSAKLSGSRERNTVSTNKHEYRLRSRSKSIPTSPVPLVQEYVTEDSDYSMQAESDESLEGFRSDSTPITKPSRMADGDQRARKVRGLKFLDALRPGQRLQVQSWLNSPVGPNSTSLATYISHLAKDGNNLPLTIRHWTQMPAVSVLKAMLEVKKVFDCPDDLNDWIRAKLQDRWKYHKHAVKKEGFYKYTTQEERLANRPKDVVESQWGPLVEYWQNPKQEALSAMMRAIKAKQTVHQRTGSKSHVKYAAELEAKLKRPPTAQEIYDATHAKRKSPVSSKKMKLSAQASAQASGSWEINAVSGNKPVHLPLSRYNSISTSPVPLIQECVTEDDEDYAQAKSDESEDIEDNMQAESDEFQDNEDNMQADSNETGEGFGSVGEPVEAARTTSSTEPVEATKTTSYAMTAVSNLVSISPPKDISAPFVGSTSVSGRGSDEEFELIDNFKIPKEYAVLYKKIFDKYGHMATKKVIKSNDTVLVACVTSLLKIISTIETARGSDLSDALLESWDGDIEDVENLGFNIKWLRNKFDEVKNNWKSSSGLRKEVEINEKNLDAKQVKHASLLARKEELLRETSKVIIEIRRTEAEISSEKKTIQEKLAPECNFLNEPILGKLLS
ncbi:uncharacterized protein LOC113311010 isoform X2 [Papaver somniferum]|nr:uncharacterized protein LOC113311010 isoform X2 [Papaver somniferum]